MLSLPIFKSFSVQIVRKIGQFLKKNKKKTLKMKKLDKSVRIHIAERKVFDKEALNKILGAAQFPGHREQNLFPVIFFVFNLSPYKRKTDEKTTEFF